MYCNQNVLYTLKNFSIFIVMQLAVQNNTHTIAIQGNNGNISPGNNSFFLCPQMRFKASNDTDYVPNVPMPIATWFVLNLNVEYALSGSNYFNVYINNTFYNSYGNNELKTNFQYINWFGRQQTNDGPASTSGTTYHLNQFKISEILIYNFNALPQSERQTITNYLKTKYNIP